MSTTVTQITNSVAVVASERKHIVHMGEVDQEMLGMNTRGQCDVWMTIRLQGRQVGGVRPGHRGH
jgi:hypothetical protein